MLYSADSSWFVPMESDYVLFFFGIYGLNNRKFPYSYSFFNVLDGALAVFSFAHGVDVVFPFPLFTKY